MSYKKRLLLVMTLMVLVLLCYFISQLTYKSKQRKDVEIAITQIPNFSQKISLLQNNIPSVFIAFHPECEHCQYEAKSINEKQKELQNIQFILFTSVNDSLAKVFSKMYGLDTLKNIHVISDKNNEMHKQFRVQTIPSVFIYNAGGKLLKQYKGETKIEAILKTLQL